MLPVVALPLVLAACQANVPSQATTARGAQFANRCPSPIPVYSGDTVYSVARQCGVSVRDLIEANNLQPPYALTGGMHLRVPGNGADYVVQHGDTLSGVARHLHVDFQALAGTNNKQAPYTIRIGEHLRVPGSYAGQQSANMTVSSPRSAPGHEPAPQPQPQQQSQSQPQSQRTAAIAPSPSPSAAPPAPPPANDPIPQPPPAQAVQQNASPAAVPPEPAAVSGHGFMWPVKGEVVLEFGPQPNKGQNNDGINIAAARGTPVRAAENGVVAYVGNELKGFGNLILIKHRDGWMTAYAHNEGVAVHRGEQVKRGQQIAAVGSTGSVTSPQLHFEIRHGTEAVDPTDVLQDGPISRLDEPEPAGLEID